MEAVLEAWPKRSTGRPQSSASTAVKDNALFKKIYDRVLTRSGLAKVFKRQGYLAASDERWLEKVYELAHRMAFGREMNVSEKYALYGK